MGTSYSGPSCFIRKCTLPKILFKFWYPTTRDVDALVTDADLVMIADDTEFNHDWSHENSCTAFKN